MSTKTPYCEHEERVTIGSILYDGKLFDDISEVVNSTDFYKPINQEIFESMVNLSNNGTEIDTVTVLSEVLKNNNREQASVAPYLSELAEIASSPKIALEMARRVLNGAQKRRLLKLIKSVEIDCCDNSKEYSEIADITDQGLFDIRSKSSSGEWSSTKEMLPQMFDEIEVARKSGGAIGVSSGFKKLDEMTTGFHGGDFILIAGRPGMCKTSLMLSMAMKSKNGCAVFSLEMPKSQLIRRLIGARSRVNMTALRAGRVSKSDMNKLGEYASEVFDKNIYVDDAPFQTIQQIRTKVRKLLRKTDVDSIMIDYIQLIETVKNYSSDQEKISYISRNIKGIAKEFDKPLICLAQVSREVDKRPNKRPTLSDLRGSGSLEQDADLVGFLYNEFYYDPETDKKGIIELNIEKQRNGPVGSVELSLEDEFMRIENLEDKRIEDHYASGM